MTINDVDFIYDIRSLYEKVEREFERQWELWGDQSHKGCYEWISIIGEEFGEFCKGVNDYVVKKDDGHSDKNINLLQDAMNEGIETIACCFQLLLILKRHMLNELLR